MKDKFSIQIRSIERTIYNTECLWTKGLKLTDLLQIGDVLIFRL